MDLRQLRYFLAVAEERHFGRAAERLGMSQPPLTQQVQKLERELGYPVFLRQPRRTSLTAAGEVLLAEARRVLGAFDQAIDRTRRAGRGETGQLTVGTPPSVMLTRLPAAIRKYRARFPAVRFTLREMSTSAIAAELEAGALDLGFLREFAAADSLETDLDWEEPVVAVLPARHRLASLPRLTLDRLAREPFVLFPRAVGSDFYDRLISFCKDAGFLPQVVQEATQWQSVVTFVETGLGVSLAPVCVQKFRCKGVVFRPLRGLFTRVSMCRPKGDPSPAAVAFLKSVRAEFRL